MSFNSNTPSLTSVSASICFFLSHIWSLCVYDMCMHMPMWKPEINIGCHYHCLTFLREVLSLNLELTNSARVTLASKCKTGIPISTSPMLRSQTPFNWGPHACTAKEQSLQLPSPLLELQLRDGRKSCRCYTWRHLLTRHCPQLTSGAFQP